MWCWDKQGLLRRRSWLTPKMESLELDGSHSLKPPHGALAPCPHQLQEPGLCLQGAVNCKENQRAANSI